jgi:hypothetical protein
VPCAYSARFRLDCYNRIQDSLAHDFYRDWTGTGFPRVLLIEIQHPTPYYDDSYAVNSENNGPYGDAIQYELIPEIERRFRGIGQGWARFTYGGSTGGWEAMAVQVFYPDEYNGAWVACPDPIDFRAYTVVNIYEDRNAYYLDSRWKRTPRPGQRNWLGQVATTLEETNHRELALGTKSRSGDQWDIWEAVYSPVGSDGYPKRIWDKLTGEIDRAVAEYWREHYDLVHILRRDWKTLGPKVRGKLFIYAGAWTTTTSTTRCISPRSSWTAPRIPTMAATWTTATAPSTAGTATTPGPTPTHACGITRCSYRGSWSRSGRTIRREPIR